MLRRDFCFLSLGSVLAGALGSSSKEAVDPTPICAIQDNEFTNEYIIYRPYQWVNSWGSYESRRIS